jgi:hypothetical protein
VLAEIGVADSQGSNSRVKRLCPTNTHAFAFASLFFRTNNLFAFTATVNQWNYDTNE